MGRRLYSRMREASRQETDPPEVQEVRAKIDAASRLAETSGDLVSAGRKIEELSPSEMVSVDSLRGFVESLRAEARELAEASRLTEALVAPEGYAILVEFPGSPDGSIQEIGVQLKTSEGDQIKYVDTRIEWWRQSGCYNELPIPSSLKLDEVGHVAFVGKSIEMTDESLRSSYSEPTFYIYNADKSMRVLHGIGWTEVSMPSLEHVESVYDQDPAPLPDSEAIFVRR